MELRHATAGDWSAVSRLLTASDLPLDGAEVAFRSGVVAVDGPRVVGCAAIEPYGPEALLRSVAVSDADRGRGIGGRLVRAAESLAVDAGATGMVLLTETAEPWFERLGYAAVPRSSIGGDIRRSIEFATACSETAVAMRRRLEPPDA